MVVIYLPTALGQPDFTVNEPHIRLGEDATFSCILPAADINPLTHTVEQGIMDSSGTRCGFWTDQSGTGVCTPQTTDLRYTFACDETPPYLTVTLTLTGAQRSPINDFGTWSCYSQSTDSDPDGILLMERVVLSEYGK